MFAFPRHRPPSVRPSFESELPERRRRKLQSSYAEVCSWEELFSQSSPSSGYHSDDWLRDESLQDPSRPISFGESDGVFSDEEMIPYPLTDSGMDCPSPSSTSSSSRSSRKSRTTNNSYRTQHNPSYSGVSLPVSLEDEVLPLHAESAFSVLTEYKKKRNLLPVNYSKYRIQNIWGTLILKYCIKSLHEIRIETEGEVPFYSGANVNESTPSNFSIWDVKIDIPSDPRKTVTKEIPGSASISSCTSCSGSGKINCSRCKGEGTHHCDVCWGSGHRVTNETHSEYNYHTKQMETRHRSHTETCHECHGAAYMRCHHCFGECTSSCSRCNGAGKLIKYSQVTAQWKMRKDKVFSAFPPHTTDETFLSKCHGIKVFENEQFDGKVPAISNAICTDRKILKSSRHLPQQYDNPRHGVNRHQRHYISMIPAYYVAYKSKSKLKSLWIVGTNHLPSNKKLTSSKYSSIF